ncbi:unnamed protein product [Pylaiella littoralis]
MQGLGFRRRFSCASSRSSSSSHDENDNNARRWWVTGEGQHRRRRSNFRFWDKISTLRANFVSESTSYSHGRGGSPLSTSAVAGAAATAAPTGVPAPAPSGVGAQELPALLTGIIRDNFLTQVKALLEGRDAGVGSGNSLNNGSHKNSDNRRGSATIPPRNPVRRLSTAFCIDQGPFDQLSPRSSSVTQGAALAYQVAILGGDGGGGMYSLSKGTEALVEAGLVMVLMRVAARETKSNSSPPHVKKETSGRVLALACLLAIVTDCRIEDDTAAAIPVRGLEGDETERAGCYKGDADSWGWDTREELGGPLILFSQALELVRLFMDIMVYGLESRTTSDVHGGEGEALADISITALELLLRACNNHDWRLNVADVNSRGAKEGTHGVMVDTIRCHRGYPSLEQTAEVAPTYASIKKRWE